MNSDAKSAIKSLVLDLRHTLEDEISVQLKRYGFAGERWLPVERLPHIDRDDAAVQDYYRLRAALDQHLRRIGADPAQAKPAQRAEAVDWFVREVAFTHLNRLVALKCLDVRGLIPEIITTRDAYGGRSRAHYDYRNAHPAAVAQADDALPDAIRHVCRHVYTEFRFLFDVGDPAAGREPPANTILWPSYPVLRECVERINGLDEQAGGEERRENGEERRENEEERRENGEERRENGEERRENDGFSILHSPLSILSSPPSLWAEDEILGWVYQFYNAEHKVAVRKRGRPRRPAEVAVINQFFTPRWIVKFLVDNTLGRLWLEMHPDSDRVRALCDYLVPEPAEEGQERGGEGENREGGSRRLHREETREAYGRRTTADALRTMSPINTPDAPARREAKRPQAIRLIDPACGTMHFGHYAFEVFTAMYRDARDHGWVTGDDALDDAAIPAAILRYNLYGVDIDLRAVQLAALSLFMKANLALRAVEGAGAPVPIAQVNLVVADAVLPTDGARTAFLAQYQNNRAVQEAVAQVLTEMENVAEVGSLLRVEERLRDLLTQAGGANVAGLEPGGQRNLPGMESSQMGLHEATGATPEQWGAHYTLARLLDDLRQFAARALKTHDLNAQLFAQEATKTVHLLDVFLNEYDVVVMNPPFGTTLNSAKNYLKKSYKAFSGNLLCSFVEKALSDLTSTGMVGAVLDRTFLLKVSYERFRKKILLEEGSVRVFTDLGWNVLDDASVEVSTIVISAEKKSSKAVFLKALEEVNLESVVNPLKEMQSFVVPMDDLKLYPNAAFAYWTPESVRKMFYKFASLEPAFGFTKEGIHPNNASRFLRQWWELPLCLVGNHKKWVRLNHGGGYAPFYRDYQWVIFYENEASEIKSLRGMRNEELQFNEGITWGQRTDLISFQYIASGYAFTCEGHMLFPHDKTLTWSALGILNSKLIQYTINTISGQHKTSGYVGQLPCIQPSETLKKWMGVVARQIYELKSTWDTGNEICTRFTKPWLVQIHAWASGQGKDAEKPMAQLLDSLGEDAPELALPQSVTLKALLDAARAVEKAADARLQALQAQIDEVVYDLYEISARDRALIERELGERPPELVWPQMERKSDKEKRREHVRRLLSWCLLEALKARRDGILPLAPGTGQPTALDAVRVGLETAFGEDAAFRMEAEVKRVLGRDIGDWLDGPFCKWHAKLYKRCPTVWHLASPKNTFSCFVYVHALDRDTLRKVQTQYLWPHRRALETDADSARAAQDFARLEAAESALDDLAEFETRLLRVIQAEVAYDSPDWAIGPFRNGIYDPVLDDGVKVNLTPLQDAEVLRYKRVI